jgi:hypothetical protein
LLIVMQNLIQVQVLDQILVEHTTLVEAVVAVS